MAFKNIWHRDDLIREVNSIISRVDSSVSGVTPERILNTLNFAQQKLAGMASGIPVNVLDNLQVVEEVNNVLVGWGAGKGIDLDAKFPHIVKPIRIISKDAQGYYTSAEVVTPASADWLDKYSYVGKNTSLAAVYWGRVVYCFTGSNITTAYMLAIHEPRKLVMGTPNPANWESEYLDLPFYYGNMVCLLAAQHIFVTDRALEAIKFTQTELDKERALVDVVLKSSESMQSHQPIVPLPTVGERQ